MAENLSQQNALVLITEHLNTINILVFRIFAINLINSLIRSSKICCSHEFGNSFVACTFLFQSVQRRER